MGRRAGTNPRFPIPRHIPQARHPRSLLVWGFLQCLPSECSTPLCCGNLCTLCQSNFSLFLGKSDTAARPTYADPGHSAGCIQMGGHGGSPEAARGRYRPAVSACRAPEFSLQGPLEIEALRRGLGCMGNCWMHGDETLVYVPPWAVLLHRPETLGAYPEIRSLSSPLPAAGALGSWPALGRKPAISTTLDTKMGAIGMR